MGEAEVRGAADPALNEQGDIVSEELHARMVVGARYAKGPSGDLPDLLNEPTLRTVREGIFYCRNSPDTALFFVDLAKDDKEQRFRFNDYFEGDFFHWDSQPSQHLGTPRIQEIATGNAIPLLFARIDQKVKGKTQPFVYCGRLTFQEHDPGTTKPVHMIFQSLDYDDYTQNEALQDIYLWEPGRSGGITTNTISKSGQVSSERKKRYTRPNRTERSGLITSRVGQGWYRQEVLKRWGGQCPVTGVDLKPVLISSHIVPWKDCSDEERLDPENGILLSPNVDSLFDRHLVTFSDTGALILSDRLRRSTLDALGISSENAIPVSDGMKTYLSRHRERLRTLDEEAST